MIPNVEICEILLFQSHLDFSYKLEIVRMMTSFEIRPSEKFIEKLERSIEFARKKILKKVNFELLTARLQSISQFMYIIIIYYYKLI
jgi:hypothetical protein